MVKEGNEVVDYRDHPCFGDVVRETRTDLNTCHVALAELLNKACEILNV